MLCNASEVFIFYGGALAFLGGAGAPASRSLAPSMLAQLISTLIIIRNVSWAAYYYDFWRSCDTENCSNDAENTEINYSLIDIHIEKNLLIFLYFYSIFAQMNAALVRRDFFRVCLSLFSVFCLFRSHSLHVCSLIYQRLNSALSFPNNLDTLLNWIEISFLCLSLSKSFHTFNAAHFQIYQNHFRETL